MRHFFILTIVLASLVITGCDAPSQSSQQHQSTLPNQQQQAAAMTATSIPSDVSFTIADSHTVPGIKRSLDVRLNKKVSEENLRVIALKLKADDPRNYERTFIAYYLPDMTIGAGAWATAHFNPNLEVRILGLTAEAEKTLTQEPVPENREIIGRWLDESPFVGSRITIYREGGTLYVEQKYKDGSSSNKELVEKSSPLGRRFDEVGGSTAGDHWILDSRGNLQLRDNEGLISTARKID